MVWERFEHPGRQPGPGGMGQAFVRRARGWGDPESFLAPRPNKDHAAIPGKEDKKSPTTRAAPEARPSNAEPAN
jgi:hypothetical protein